MEHNRHVEEQILELAIERTLSDHRIADLIRDAAHDRISFFEMGLGIKEILNSYKRGFSQHFVEISREVNNNAILT